MRCDVLAVGTELLLGQIVDTNSSWIGEQLAAHGISSHVQVKVGDNVDRIIEQLRRRLDDADAVIMCGGLGPTHDDLTRDAIAAVMGVELRHDEEVAEAIVQMFASRGRRMAANNLRQAQVPVGATVIPQRRGTAPGLICPVGDKVVYAVPGVPHEVGKNGALHHFVHFVRHAGNCVSCQWLGGDQGQAHCCSSVGVVSECSPRLLGRANPHSDRQCHLRR